jgi:hypothetical protein
MLSKKHSKDKLYKRRSLTVQYCMIIVETGD